jgi:hypothetical protein
MPPPELAQTLCTKLHTKLEGRRPTNKSSLFLRSEPLKLRFSHKALKAAQVLTWSSWNRSSSHIQVLNWSGSQSSNVLRAWCRPWSAAETVWSTHKGKANEMGRSCWVCLA